MTTNLCQELWQCWQWAFAETLDLCAAYLSGAYDQPGLKDDECPVCFEDYVAAQGRVTRCGHQFCRRCLQLWRRRSTECPICRQTL